MESVPRVERFAHAHCIHDARQKRLRILQFKVAKRDFAGGGRQVSIRRQLESQYLRRQFRAGA